MTEKPLVSVIMPTFNSAEFLAAAVDSILRQSFTDLELIVVNDGSTDGTGDLLQGVHDPRLVTHHLPSNQGLAAARNAGIQCSQGEFIAWLDADDLSDSDRLGLQVQAMRSQPGVGMCGTWVRTIGVEPVQTWRYPRKSKYIAARMLFDDPFATSSVMVRREALLRAGPFNPALAPAEDYDLWERVAREWRLVNLPRALTFYRVHEGQTSVRDRDHQQRAIRVIQERQLSAMGVAVSDEQWRIHSLVGVEWGRGLVSADLAEVHRWLDHLSDANDASGFFPRAEFAAVVHHRRLIAEQTCHPSGWRKVAVRIGTARQ